MSYIGVITEALIQKIRKAKVAAHTKPHIKITKHGNSECGSYYSKFQYQNQGNYSSSPKKDMRITTIPANLNQNVNHAKIAGCSVTQTRTYDKLYKSKLILMS